jgi:hypothetical protein
MRIPEFVVKKNAGVSFLGEATGGEGCAALNGPRTRCG